MTNETPLRILIVEDVPRDADMETRELRRAGIACEVRVADSQEAMLTALAEFAPDFILSDYTMPGFSGLEALDIRNERAPDLPFVIVTGSIGDDTAVDCLHRGADDYVTKEHLGRLAPAVRNATAKRRLEHEAQEAHEAVHLAARQWQTSFDAMMEAVTVLDPGQTILRCNTAMRELVGRPLDEIIGRPCCRLVHGFDQPPPECPALRASASLERETWQTTIGERWFDVVADPILDDDGSLIGLVHAMHDITERRQAEAHQALHARILAILNRANAWQDLLGDLLNEIKTFGTFDAVGIRLKEGEDYPYYVQNGFADEFVRLENHLACQANGRIQRDAQGRPVLPCTCGLVLSGVVPADNPLFTPNGSFWSNDTRPLLELPAEQDPRHEPRNRCIHEGYLSVALIPLRAGDQIIGLLQLNDRRVGRFTPEQVRFFEEVGNSIGIAVVRQQTQRLLAASETRHRLLFEASRDAIMTLAPPSWRFTSGNPATLAMFRVRDEADLTSRAPWEYSPPNQPDGRPSAEKAREMIEIAMREGTHFFEWTHMRLDGEVFPATVLLTRFELSGEALLQATIRDVTDQRNTETQLRQAQKMESVGRLAGGVAHDFNNLLMGIMNYVELCRDGVAPDDPIREWLDEITGEAQRSANLTRQLLAFARKQTIAPRVLDLNAAVEGMLKMLRRLIGEDIDLLWQPQSNLWPVKLDPGQVDQILANLCVNARDAIGGVGKVTIETANAAVDASYCAEHVEAVPGAYAVLAVSDDGCGMDQNTLDHIFEPFFTTKPVGEGTGLGLATIYGIVRQNDGFVNVYSEPGEGTTFRIYLPRFAGEEAEQARTEKTTERLGGSETILLVEDEKSIRVTTALFLEQLGYTVLTAEQPDEALSRVSEHLGSIHLLVTDVVMPGMSGRDLAAKLGEQHPRMKCLFISGYTANVIAHRGILDADVEFLAKPFSRDDIARKVRDVLDA